jgi:hypothetical protein
VTVDRCGRQPPAGRALYNQQHSLATPDSLRLAPTAATFHTMEFSAHIVLDFSARIVRVCFFVVEVESPFTAASYRVTASSPAALYVIRHIVHCSLHPTSAPFARPSYVLKYLTAGAGFVPSPPHSTLSHLRYISPPPPRSVLRARTAQSLLPHTHTVYVYIYPTQPIALTLAAVDLIRRQTALPLLHTEPMSVPAGCVQSTCGFRRRH